MNISIKIRQEKFDVCISEETLTEVKERIKKESIWKDIAVVLSIIGVIVLLYNVTYENKGFFMQGTVLIYFLGILALMKSYQYADRLHEDEAFARRLICDKKCEEIEIQDGILKIIFFDHGYMEKLNVLLAVARQDIKQPVFDLLDMVLYIPNLEHYRKEEEKETKIC